MTDEDADARRERREWIRSNHPDMGGDTAKFAEGLRELGSGASGPRKTGQSSADRASTPAVHRTRSIRRTVKRLYRKANAIVRRRRRRSRRVR